MLWTIFLKELKSQLKSPAFYIFAGLVIFGTTIFVSSTTPGVTFFNVSFGKEWHNAPIDIAKLLDGYCLIGVLFTMIIVGRAVAKDFGAGIHEFFFTSPVRKIEYLGGRFLGGLAANLLAFSGVVLGFFAAGLRLPAGYYGPFNLWSFILPTLVIVVPNLILTGSVFFGLASLTRKMVNTYVAGVVFFLAYVLTAIAFTRVDNDLLKMLGDPFAASALDTLTRFWTVAEMNVRAVPMDPRLLLNRALWLIVAGGVMFVTWRKFKLTSVLEGKKRSVRAEELASATGAVRSLEPLSESRLDDSLFCRLTQFLSLAAREFRLIAFHPAFVVLTFIAMGEIFVNFLMNVNQANYEVYPFTSFFLQYTSHIWIYMIPITILFGGLIVWRERDNRSHEFYDAMPVPHWTSMGAKLAALLSVQFCYVLIAMLVGIFVQVGIVGFRDIEPMLYLKGLFGIEFMKFAFMAVLVVFIQNLSPNKYVGFFVSAAYFLGDLVLFEFVKSASPIFRFGHVPKYIYSNLNGFGHYAPMIIWYTVYWLLFAALLMVVTSLLWRHGNETGLRYRLRLARQKIGPLQSVSLSVLGLMFLGTGSFIYYNRHILNTYISADGEKEMQAAYEKEFASLLKAPQPAAIDVKLTVDLFPEERRALLKGSYLLVNTTSRQIPEIFVNLSDRFVTKVNRLSFEPPARLSRGPEEFGFRVFSLERPMQPGDTVRLDFDLEAAARGFTDNNPKNEIAANGTCIIFSGTGGNGDYFPGIGFNKTLMLTDSYDRKKHGLPAKSPLPTLEECDRTVQYGYNHLVAYEAEISTSGDQTAVSNGDLVRQWQENGRSHFRYRSVVPIHDEFIIASGRYRVLRATHAGVTIEVYHDARHAYNVQRMVKGVSRGLDLCTKAFSPYPYTVQRIVEIPDYMEEGGARSQPTVFIWRESAGFVSNLDKPDRTDRVFGIAAHELGHQWWAYIVCPAYAEGLYLPTENVCQYVWDMCLEKEYGRGASEDFRKHEMEGYLRSRKRDTKGERPLIRTVEGQDYLGYQKGGLALYALQDYIGEDNLNRALGNIVKRFGFWADLYVTSRDMVEEFRAATPESLQYVVEDLFQTITIYENKALSAESRKLADGRYLVTLTVEANKFRADSVGTQSEIPVNDYIYLGVLDEEGRDLYLRKHKIKAGRSAFEIIVDKKPTRAGIDPDGILIDRDREDNLVKVRTI